MLDTAHGDCGSRGGARPCLAGCWGRGGEVCTVLGSGAVYGVLAVRVLWRAVAACRENGRRGWGVVQWLAVAVGWTVGGGEVTRASWSSREGLAVCCYVGKVGWRACPRGGVVLLLGTRGWGD